MIIGTAGHIDHGKTSLVRALTGVETDRLKEEKARGITIELGFAYQPIAAEHPEGPQLGFVDMPGHEKFIHTMLAGATGIGMALLVVAADDGVMPQTREHLQILQLLGLQQGVIALTKIDRVDAARQAEVEREVRALVATTFLADAKVFACSAVRGDGVAELLAFLHEAAARESESTASTADGLTAQAFRLAVDRCFSIEGRGTIVTGTVHAGHLSTGDSLRLLPSANSRKVLTARVRGMHVHNQKATHCVQGQRVALNLAGIEHTAIERGDWVTALSLNHRSDRLSVMLRLLPEARALKHWSPVHLHAGAAHTMARVGLLEGELLAPGQTMLAELSLETALHLCHGDRIVLRDASAQATIAGCEVIDIYPPTRGKRNATRLQLLRAQHNASDAAALAALLANETLGVNLARFAAGRNLSPERLSELIAPQDALQIDTGDGLYACAFLHWQAMQERLLHEMAMFHEREPDNVGVERERLRRRALPTLDKNIFAPLLETLVRDERVVTAQRSFVALPSHKVSFTDAEQQRWSLMLPLLAAQAFQPPRVRPIAKELGMDEPEMRRLLGKSAKLGLTYLVAHDHYFLSSAVEAMAGIVQSLIDEFGFAKVAPFRDRIATGRKLAVEILEFYDRVGYTRRIGEQHVMRQAEMWKA